MLIRWFEECKLFELEEENGRMIIISIIDKWGVIKGWFARSTFIYPGIRFECGLAIQTNRGVL